MYTLQNSLNKYAETPEPHPKKQIIMLLVVDSASRRHFYRKLPKTVEFLDNLDSKKHRLFDFKIHNVHGDNSVRNTLPIFTGNPKAMYHGDKLNDGDPNYFFKGDMLDKRSLFHYM